MRENRDCYMLGASLFTAFDAKLELRWHPLSFHKQCDPLLVLFAFVN